MAQDRSAGNSPCELCFYGPDNIVFDAAGNAYITDTDHKTRFRILNVADDKLHRIQKFDSSGRLLVMFGGSALFTEGPGGVAIDQRRNIYSPDGLAIVKLSPSGKFLERWR